MSGLCRFSSFPPAGPPSWPSGDKPVWRGGAAANAGWWHPGAAFALDFLSARAMRGDAEILLSSALSTARSSTALLADTSGVHQTFGVNTLARVTGIGAYIGGQVAPLVKYNADISAGPNWTGYLLPKVKLAGTRLGIFSRVQVASLGANYQRIASPAFVPATTAPHFVTIYYEPGTSGRIHVEFIHNGGLYLINGPAGAVNGYVYSGVPGTVGGLSDVLMADGVTRRLSFVWTPAATSSSIIQIGPDTNVSGDTIIICGADVQPVGYETPFIVSGASVATRLASDVRAASIDWFGAASLHTGASELVVPRWSHVGDAVERPLFEFSDGTADNLIKGYIDATDKPRLRIVAGGVTQTDTALAASIASGRKPVAFGWSAAGGYVADKAGNVATFGPVTLPTGLAQKRVGGSVASNFLNDTLEQLQTCHALSQAEALAWVQAA